MLTRRSAMLLPLVAPLLTAPTNVSAAAKGEFKGRILAEWLPDSRKMQLAEPFEFISPDGRRWPVPAGTVLSMELQFPRCSGASSVARSKAPTVAPLSFMTTIV